MLETKKNNEKSFTAGMLIQGMILCRENATELIEEADILASKDRNTRAFALLYTACEELGKFSVLELGATRLLNGIPPDWKRFWQRFRSHDSKSAQLELQIQALALSSASGDDFSALAKIIFGNGLTARNASLYVDDDRAGAFRKPSDMSFDIPLPGLRTLAGYALAATNQRGADETAIEAYLRIKPNEERRKTLVKLLTQVIERGRDAGLEKEQIIALLEKARK